MPAYNTARFSPPAPLGTIELRNPTNGAVCANVPMLLDTGADVTLLPRECLQQLKLQAEPGQVFELMGFDGNRTSAHSVQLELRFLGLTFRGRFLLLDQSEGILGRNILNHLHLRFDGPRLVWESFADQPSV